MLQFCRSTKIIVLKIQEEFFMQLRRGCMLFFCQLKRLTLCLGVAAIAFSSIVPAQDKGAKPEPDNRVQKANYELASRWTPAKVGKMLFDTSVTPHWLETGDRFWYSYETNSGKRFVLVDPLKKTKTPVFDAAKMAAMLTTLTRIPYDALHLPITTIHFTKNDTAIRLDVSVPRDAVIPGLKAEEPPARTAGATGAGTGQTGEQAAGPGPAGGRNRTIYFEYDLASAQLKLLPDYTPPRKARWASVSPDEKTVIFARGQNLFMMDADNYAKALKKDDDATIVETQLTTDGEEFYSYARRLTEEEKVPYRFSEKNKTPRVPSIRVIWSKDSKKISVVKVDQRKVADLWVINSLSNPRPKLETYRYGMPGEVNQPQSEIEVFDLGTKARVKMKSDKFKDQQVSIYTAPVSNLERERARVIQLDRTGEQDQQQQQQQQQGGGPQTAGVEPRWLSDTGDKLYFNRTSRDMHRVDVCVADTTTGEVKTLIEERLNTYIEFKPLWLINNGQELVHWSERDGWGHYYLFDANGTLKNQITSGEFYADSIESIDEKTRTLYLMANGREPNEDPYYEHAYKIGLDGNGMKLLDPGDASHAVSMSDSGKYFVNNSSRVNTAPESVLYDQLGNKADAARNHRPFRDDGVRI